MKCPHCSVAFHVEWQRGNIQFKRITAGDLFLASPEPESSDSMTGDMWSWLAARCPECRKPIIGFRCETVQSDRLQTKESYIVYPRFPVRAPIDNAVPESFRVDFIEACNVLPTSPKASAALSRRESSKPFLKFKVIHQETWLGKLNAY